LDICYFSFNFKLFFYKIAGDKDTRPEDLIAKSFVPKYKTFEQDLMDEYGIKETKERAETYFY
jgi:hypothetical protein